MSLFGTSQSLQEANFKACEQMVVSFLAARGLDVGRSRIESETGPAWELRHGSAEVYIFLSAGEGDNYIQVVSPVMVPTADSLQRPELLRRLLELNANELTGAAFGLRDDEVVLTTDRATAGLDRVELEEMVQRVAEYADHYDDALTVEFGGSRAADL